VYCYDHTRQRFLEKHVENMITLNQARQMTPRCFFD
jgi:hypothetical protein